MTNKKIEEIKILLRRFFQNSEKIYGIGKFLDLKWFDQFDEEFKSRKGVYISSDKEKEAIDLIANSIDDEQLKHIFEKLEPNLGEIDCFRGKHYSFKNGIFEITNKQNEVTEDVFKVLDETGEKGYAFLKAIIDLYEENKWDSAYGGAKFSDILSKMREIVGKSTIPPPRDYPLFKSYKLYYKTGSNKYRTHTIPIEIIPAVKDALEDWREEKKELKNREKLIQSKQVQKVKSTEKISFPITESRKFENMRITENKMPKIFIAYAKEDKKQVDNLYLKLKEAGFKPWLDDKNILPGERWREKISEEINNSDFFLACLSKNSVAKKGYVQREFKTALEAYAERPSGDIYLIPVRLDDCNVPDLKVGTVNLRDFQWVDFFKPDGLEKILESIKTHFTLTLSD